MTEPSSESAREVQNSAMQALSPVQDEGVQFEPHQREEGTHDSTRVIRENQSLPNDAFPDTRLPKSQSNEKSHAPTLLRSRDELSTLLAESRVADGFSNYSEATLARNTAYQSGAPFLEQFCKLPFIAEAETHGSIAPNPDPSAGASSFDLVFPVSLSVTDGNRIPLPGDMHFLHDSSGYPLFFQSTRSITEVRTSNRGALFSTKISRALLSRFGDIPDLPVLKALGHMFQLNDDSDAMLIFQQRIKAATAGDNHISLLVRAYLAYFDSIAAQMDGVTAHQTGRLTESGVVNVNKNSAWVSASLSTKTDIVNVIGQSNGAQQFWAHCCLSQPAFAAAKLDSGGIVSTTAFSHYRLTSGQSLICLCDYDVALEAGQPLFFGRPDLIIGYIESYIQRNSLQRQANEALQIAMAWPTLCQLRVQLSLPASFHSTDWLAGEVERVSEETAYRTLLSAGLHNVLASSLVAPLVLRSQVYDYLSLVLAHRGSAQVSQIEAEAAIAWLAPRASAPGSGWHFLLNRHLGISSSMLYFTGLSSQVVNWNSFLEPILQQGHKLPCHVRLMQAFWSSTSLSCLLPWERTWRPQLDINGMYLSATKATLMLLVRLGILHKNSLNTPQEGLATHASHFLLHQDLAATQTIRFDLKDLERLRVARSDGLRVMAIYGQSDSSFRSDAL